MKLRILFLTILSVFFCEMQALTLQEAKALAQAHDYENALVAFKSLIHSPKYAKNAECNKFYGQCLCMTGDYKGSIRYLEEGARGKVTGAWWYLGISRQHTYDFQGAITALEKYKSLLSANSSWIPRSDSIIAECEIGLRALNHVQDVVIIDSLQVNKQNFFAHYKLGNESGHIIHPDQCAYSVYARADSAAAFFENLKKDYRLMSFRDEEDGRYHLYSSSFFEGEWTEPEKIESIGGGDYKVAFPFMRSDGETLYFACDSTPGLGGYDIYMTRFDSDNDSFLTPTRLGMPFNSPDNDYMMAIDETNQVGWWATDRGANEGFVKIFVFLLDDETEYLTGENVARARIDRIADTWREENYNELLEQIKNPVVPVAPVASLFIPIREGVIYTSLDDFRSSEARDLYEFYMILVDDLAETKADLKRLREDYAKATDDGKKLLRQEIIQKEAKVCNLHEEVKAAAKKYREAEVRF